jgi:hypothetical protein
MAKIVGVVIERRGIWISEHALERGGYLKKRIQRQLKIHMSFLSRR